MIVSLTGCCILYCLCKSKNLQNDENVSAKKTCKMMNHFSDENWLNLTMECLTDTTVYYIFLFVKVEVLFLNNRIKNDYVAHI